MKKIYGLFITLAVIAAIVTTALKAAPNYSLYDGSLYPEGKNGTVQVMFMAEQIAGQDGLFVRDGQGFTARMQTIARISGNCHSEAAQSPIYGYMAVDSDNFLPLFAADSPPYVSSFDATYIGRRFIIVVSSAYPVHCNLFMEAVQ